MTYYKIRWGLGGGFNDIEESEEFYAYESREEALDEAFDLASDEYARYEGLSGIRSITQIMEEEDLEKKDAIDVYEQEKLRYIVFEIIDERESLDSE